jgi:orotidine-5'-phosphate decarboxylase
MDAKGKCIVALDGFCKARWVAFITAAIDRGLAHAVYAWKIHDLWDREGPDVVRILKKAGASRVMVDLKLHDTSATVALRANAVREAGGDIVTVHASGGTRMMREAVEHGPPEIYAVTLLTSLREEMARRIYGMPVFPTISYQLQMAEEAEVSGIISSVRGLAFLRNDMKAGEMKCIAAAIRETALPGDDQECTGGVEEAFRAGADLVILGREISLAKDPMAALEALCGVIRSIADESLPHAGRRE